MKSTAKVLIVDDDKSSSQMLSEVIRRMGLKPVVVNKPADAVNLVKLQTVHAAIVDVLLPKMSGVDLVQEFRATKFGDNPVVLVSGVFKDKAFANDAIKKTNAVDFLFKPFGADELMKSLNVAFKEALDAHRTSIATLLSRKLPTARDRVKAIENLEPIHGNDFLYVLSLAMTGSISGHFNIVNEAGEIFGVTLVKGKITDVDSTESQSAGVLALINKGFLSQQDWEEFQQAGNKKFTLEKLVQEGYVSPHGVALAKHEQIMADLKAISSAEELKLNFNPASDGETPPKHSVQLVDLVTQIFEAGDEFFKPEYLTNFYSNVYKAPMRLAVDEATLETIWGRPMYKSMTGFREVIERSGTLAEAISEAEGREAEIYRTIHFLVLERAVLFADMERAKSLTEALDRYQKMLFDLKDLSADQVFEYFGAGEMASPKAVEGIFNEYTKANHPNLLPADASPDLKASCEQVMEIIKTARDTMVSETLRAELQSRKKSANAERQKKSQEFVSQGLDLLRKGQAAQALERLKEAEKMHPSPIQTYIRVWAEIKANPNPERSWLLDTVKKVESFPQDDRKSAYYFMAMGLLKKAMSDQTCVQFFEKAMSADPSFVEARREINSLDAKESAKDKKVDLLTGDITEVISQLFRRKAE